MPAHALRVYAGSLGLDPSALQPGSDLVIELAPQHGLDLARGAALDDYLRDCARAEIDAEALTRLASWRAAIGDALTVEGVDLAHVWEVELLAECFLPSVRLHRCLAHALREDMPERMELHGLRPEFVELIQVLAAEAGVRAVTGDRAGDLLPPIPRGRPPLPVRMAVRTTAFVGVPPRVRGRVLCFPYWHLAPLYRRLAELNGNLQPVGANFTVAGLTPAGTLSAAARGGWSGYPGARARARSRRTVAALLDTAAASAPAGDDSVGAAIHRVALGVLRRRAQDTLADAAHARRVLGAKRLRLLVVPADSPEAMRVFVGAAHDTGRPSLVIQHGFDSGLNDPDKELAPHVAVWNERDRAATARRSSAQLYVTGNPGAAHLARRRATPPRRVRTIVLVEYASRISAKVGSRVGMQHVATALQALAHERPGTEVVIRPHPADPSPRSFERFTGKHSLVESVDSTTPIEDLLQAADLCIGALSTSTLQAAALGVPTVFLDLTVAQRPWPFDGAADALPRACDELELRARIAELLGVGPVRGSEAAVEALGVREDAVDRVLDVVATLVGD